MKSSKNSNPVTPARNASKTVVTPLNKQAHRTPLLASARSASSSIASSPYTPLGMKSRFSSAFATPVIEEKEETSAATASKPPRSSFADTSSNWRNRAQENGIKVSSAEMDEIIIRTGSAQPLTPAFRSNNRRRLQPPHSISSPETSLLHRSIVWSPEMLPKLSDYHGSRRSIESVPPRSLSHSAVTSKATPSRACSACGVKASGPSILVPCSHSLCHQCFTGVLNIAGEKNTECPVCKQHITDFVPSSVGKLDIDALVHSHVLDSKATPDSFGASDTERIDKLQLELPSSQLEPTVIRVDNVPWDLTPAMLLDWLALPTLRAHVLIERRTGKTQSYCFAEMSLENAKAALRTCQNKVLGFGRRARAVSVNISSQEELMKELFPTWRGHFIGSQPSVNGLEGGPLTEVLDAGLISFDELDSLLALLRNPNAHFLKVPSLPYHSLISILQKFPVHGDSRVFWTNVLRDQLFTVAHAAVKILTAQWEQPDFDADLFDQVAAAAATCPAFTDIQRHLITEIATAPSFADLPSLDRSLSNSPVPMETVPPTPQDEHEHQLFQPQSSMSDNPATSSYYNPGPANAKPMLPRALFDEIGNEVGVDATLVRMIFQKLTHMVL